MGAVRRKVHHWDNCDIWLSATIEYLYEMKIEMIIKYLIFAEILKNHKLPKLHNSYGLGAMAFRQNCL